MTNSAIDMEFLRSITGGDQEFEKELFDIFVDNAKKNLTNMEAALKDEDGNAWYMASHAFKGAAASIGAFELSKALEYAQKHPEDSNEEKNRVLAKVRGEFDTVLGFIKQEMA